MPSHLQTEAPGKTIVLFDGDCRFCAIQVKKLLALARPHGLEAVNFQEPGVLERFPGLTHAECMKAMQLITPEGRVYRGFEAAVRALATRPYLGWVTWLYYLPGVRQVCDAAYAWIARNRYRLMGKTDSRSECQGGTCSSHQTR